MKTTKATYGWGGGPALPLEQDARAELVRRPDRHPAGHIHNVRLGVAVSAQSNKEQPERPRGQTTAADMVNEGARSRERVSQSTPALP